MEQRPICRLSRAGMKSGGGREWVAGAWLEGDSLDELLGAVTCRPARVPVTQPSISNEPMAVEAGVRFASRYHVKALLGEGGMASVYRATDTLLDREVALKVVASDGRDFTAAPRARRRIR